MCFCVSGVAAFILHAFALEGKLNRKTPAPYTHTAITQVTKA